jgi:PKD domain
VTAPRRHLVLGLVLGLSLLLTDAVCARAADSPAASPVDARVISAFVMNGRIVTAVRVRGERRGQRITRHWSFTGRSCLGNACARLLLHRERSAHRYSRLMLSRVGVGRYAGRGRFYAGLRCLGRTDPRGEVVPYRITVTVTDAVAIQGVEFAQRLTASYTNLKRIDHTSCPVGPSHDAARYTGVASPLPTPPSAAFSAVLGSAPDSARFTDTSARGAGGAAVVGWLWNFGDAPSGNANESQAQNPIHAFTGPGTYHVCMIVTDANGLRSGLCNDLTIPAPGGSPPAQLSKRSVATTAANSPTNRAGRVRAGEITAYRQKGRPD